MTNHKHLRVATYNIQFGVNKEKLISSIQKLANDGANIICLQEIINVSNEEFIVDVFLKRLGEKWQATTHVGKENSKLSIGTCILWNSDVLKLKYEKKILLPKLKKFDLHEKLFYKLIGVQGIPLQRKAVSCCFQFNNKTLRVTSLHIDNVGGPIHRLKQISYLLAQLDTFEISDYEIICGDFNTFDLLRTGYERRLLEKKFGKDFIDASKTVGWTCDIYNFDFKTSIPIFPWVIKTFNIHIRSRLDYIWVRNIKVLECKKITLHGSDHYPIVADLEI